MIESTILHNVTYIYESPCEILRRTYEQKNLSDSDLKIVNTSIDRCREMFDKVWKIKLEEVVLAWSKSSLKAHRRNKRFVPLAIAAYLVVSSSIHMTGFILGAVSLHKVNNLRDELDELKNKVFNLTELNSQMHSTNVDVLNNLNSKLHNITTDLNKFKVLLGNLSWEISKLVYDIEKSISLLEEIEAAAEYDQVNLRALSQLFNYPQFKRYSQKGSKIHSIERINDNILNFVFSVKSKADNIEVVKNYGITHWVNLSSEPRLVKYTGPIFTLKNNTNNCKIGIEQIGNTFSYEQCSRENYEDARLRSGKRFQ